MAKKIIVITTGGTIGSILQSESMSVDASEKKIAKEIELANKTLGYQVDTLSAINKNSEALAPADWIDILTSIRAACKTDCDGIVVTHGTDTMAYTLATTLVLSELWQKKICFTGAFYAPDHPLSDSALSLKAALAFAASEYALPYSKKQSQEDAQKGVFLAFRSDQTNRKAHIFHGFDVKRMGFDEHSFASIYGRVIGEYCAEKGLSTFASNYCTPYPYINNVAIPSKEAMTAANKKIAFISLYPGLDGDTLKAISAGKDIVVVDLYHSGTGPTSEDGSELSRHISSQSQRTLFLMGTFPSEYIDTPYQSTLDLIQSGGLIYKDIQAHFLYVFSLLSLALGKSVEEIKAQLTEWEIG